MSRVLKIEISETADELRKLLSSAENHKIKKESKSRWLRSYKTGGIDALLAKGKSTGRSRKTYLIEPRCSRFTIANL